MAEKTVGERLASVEQWKADHETRCDERQAAMGREIRDMKSTVRDVNDAVAGLKKGAWGIVVAICAWALVQVYGYAKAPASAPTELHVQR